MQKYDELTPEQKIKVTKMYADLSDLRAYLYNFDKNGYHGRIRLQVVPPTSLPEVGAPPPPPSQEPMKEEPAKTTRRRGRKPN